MSQPRSFDPVLFHDPPAAYRPVPIWFWNGDIDAAEVVRQVRAMPEGGLGGFQIAARTGLTTPYLSNRWFHLVDTAAREAERLGRETWLADEYPYPSGASGGEVILRHPEYRAWRMSARHQRVPPSDRVTKPAPGTVLLAAAAVPARNERTDWAQAIDLAPDVGLTQPELVFLDTGGAFLSRKRTLAAGPIRLSRPVELPAVHGAATLRLPDDALMFAGVAALAVNGYDLGVRPWAPYAWPAPAGTLRPGTNHVTLSLTNTLCALLEGTRYDPIQRRIVPVWE